MSKKIVPSWVAGIQPFDKLPVGGPGSDIHAAGVQRREELIGSCWMTKSCQLSQ
jgi:hypothetical protein